MAERCTPDRIFESSPRSFGVGSKIGYHHHQPGRPATDWMLGEIHQDWQGATPKKMVLGLHRSHQIFHAPVSSRAACLRPELHPAHRTTGVRAACSRSI